MGSNNLHSLFFISFSIPVSRTKKIGQFAMFETYENWLDPVKIAFTWPDRPVKFTRN